MEASDNIGLEVHTESNGNGTITVVVTGELDVATAPILEQALTGENADAAVMVLDLRGVSFIDSNGLSVVAGQHQRAKARGARFAVATGGAHQVERLFSISGLSETIELIEAPSQLVER